MRTRFLSSSLLFSMLLSLLLLACGPVTAADAPAKPPVTEEDKTLYALGLMLSRNLQAFELTPAELAFVMQGIADGASGKPTVVKMEEYAPKVQALGQAKSEKRAAAEKAKGQAFLAAEAAKPGVTKTESGVLYTETLAGTGPSPAATDKVKVHYTGKLLDGKVFDSSVERGEPVTFPLNGVIPGWTEGIQLLAPGAKATLFIPPNLAYGPQGRPPVIPPNSALIFDVELIEIVK